MKGHVALSLIAMTLLSACTPEPTQFDVAGIEIGDTRASVFAKAPNLTCGVGERGGVEECIGSGPSFNGAPTAFFRVDFDGGKVEFLMLTAEATGFDKAVSALRTKYGPVGKGEHEASVTPSGMTTWTRWGKEGARGRQVLMLGKPENGRYLIALKGPMFMAMHEVMPRLNLPTPDLKGVRLGDSVTTVKARFPDVHCNELKTIDLCTAPSVQFGGTQNASIFMLLVDDSVKQISVTGLDADNFPYLQSALINKFGPSDDADQRKWHPNIPSTHILWSMPYNHLISLIPPTSKDDGRSPGVYFEDENYFAEVARRQVTESEKHL